MAPRLRGLLARSLVGCRGQTTARQPIPATGDRAFGRNAAGWRRVGRLGSLRCVPWPRPTRGSHQRQLSPEGHVPAARGSCSCSSRDGRRKPRSQARRPSCGARVASRQSICPASRYRRARFVPSRSRWLRAALEERSLPAPCPSTERGRKLGDSRRLRALRRGSTPSPRPRARRGPRGHWPPDEQLHPQSSERLDRDRLREHVRPVRLKLLSAENDGGGPAARRRRHRAHPG